MRVGFIQQVGKEAWHNPLSRMKVSRSLFRQTLMQTWNPLLLFPLQGAWLLLMVTSTCRQHSQSFEVSRSLWNVHTHTHSVCEADCYKNIFLFVYASLYALEQFPTILFICFYFLNNVQSCVTFRYTAKGFSFIHVSILFQISFNHRLL